MSQNFQKRYLKTIEIKDLFKFCCYHERPNVFLRALRIFGHNQQLEANSLFVETNTEIKKTCGWCKKDIDKNDFDYFAGYWTPFIWRPVHKECKEAYKSSEVLACQIIDADCNYCKNFDRIKSVGVGIFLGTCKKFNTETRGYVDTCSMKECFEHRRA